MSTAGLLLPAVALFLALFALPLGGLLRDSIVPTSSGGAPLTLDQYARFFSDPYYVAILGRTLVMGAIVTALVLVFGYPMAYWIARTEARPKGLLLSLTVFPLLTSAVVRSFGWMVLFYQLAPLNTLLMHLHVIQHPLTLAYTLPGVVIALAEVLMPFMVLTLYPVIEGIDRSLEEAALDLGSGPFSTLFRVTLPLSKGGILSGSLLVFSLAISSFVTPSLVGGAKVHLMATLIEEETITLLNWPFAAAVAGILLVVVLAAVLLYSRTLDRARASSLGLNA